MPTILVVEGRTDAVFFRELFDRLYPQRLDVEFRNSEGKYHTPDVIRGLLDAGVLELIVVQDTNGRTADETVRSIQQMVYSHLSVDLSKALSTDRKFTLSERSIAIIPMGLHGDQALKALGVTQHALEDYLIRLILEDARLRERVPTLATLLPEILPAIRDQEGPFDKSKEIFQLIKPMVQHGFSDTGVVEKLVKDADETILRSVLAPLLVDVELAFDLQTS